MSVQDRKPCFSLRIEAPWRDCGQRASACLVAILPVDIEEFFHRRLICGVLLPLQAHASQTRRQGIDDARQFLLADSRYFGKPAIVRGCLQIFNGVDLKLCMEMMEKTGAYGFYLRFGKHIRFCYMNGQPQPVPDSIPLAQNIYAWDLKEGKGDWGFPNNVDMTVFRKADLKEAFEKMKYKTPNSLESIWATEYAPAQDLGTLGLYFERSKIVNIPLNIVSRTGNPHMNFSSPEDLLAKFNEGWKIDIEPLHRIVNDSPHFECIPEFVAR